MAIANRSRVSIRVTR